MHDVVVVAELECLGDSLHDFGDGGFVANAGLDDTLEEIFALHVFHNDVEGVGIVVDLVDLDDVFVLELR